jgi:maleate cis-trans isomerase
MTYVKKTHRFGLLTPSSNTTQEPEFSAALPPTISLHTGRVAYRDITPEEQDRCVLELESESRKLAMPKSTSSCSRRRLLRSPRARATIAS